MQLKELVAYTEERCRRERPIFYAGIYVGRDPREKKITFIRKDRPMRLLVGIIDGMYNLSSPDNPISQVEFQFDPPWIELQLGPGEVIWRTCACIDVVVQGDIAEFNRTQYGREVRENIKKWKDFSPSGCSTTNFYERNNALLKPFFLLVDELERQRDALVSRKACETEVAGI